MIGHLVTVHTQDGPALGLVTTWIQSCDVPPILPTVTKFYNDFVICLFQFWGKTAPIVNY